MGFRTRFERCYFGHVWDGFIDDEGIDEVVNFGEYDPTQILDIGALGSGESFPDRK
ncbi:MAG: hypothetical protein Q9224_007065, partial [Gallowayella concinna]